MPDQVKINDEGIEHTGSGDSSSLRLGRIALRRASEVFADRIREMVLRGELTPGSPLPTERELAAETGLGRSSIREGLRALSAEGLISSRPGRGGGSWVRLPDLESVALSIRVFIRGRPVAYRSLVEVRRVLEPGCARLAALHADESGLLILAEWHDRMKTADEVSDVDQFGEANVGWHRQVAHLADNELLEALNEGVALILESGFLIDEFFREPRSRWATLEAHERIMKAIAAHDPNQAWQAMVDHMRSHDHEWDERLGTSVIPIPTNQGLPDEDEAK